MRRKKGGPSKWKPRLGLAAHVLPGWGETWICRSARVGFDRRIVGHAGLGKGKVKAGLGEMLTRRSKGSDRGDPRVGQRSERARGAGAD